MAGTPNRPPLIEFPESPRESTVTSTPERASEVQLYNVASEPRPPPKSKVDRLIDLQEGDMQFMLQHDTGTRELVHGRDELMKMKDSTARQMFTERGNRVQQIQDYVLSLAVDGETQGSAKEEDAHLKLTRELCSIPAGKSGSSGTLEQENNFSSEESSLRGRGWEVAGITRLAVGGGAGTDVQASNPPPTPMSPIDIIKRGLVAPPPPPTPLPAVPTSNLHPKVSTYDINQENQVNIDGSVFSLNSPSFGPDVAQIVTIRQTIFLRQHLVLHRVVGFDTLRELNLATNRPADRLKLVEAVGPCHFAELVNVGMLPLGNLHAGSVVDIMGRRYKVVGGDLVAV